MSRNTNSIESAKIAFLFVLLPTIMLILGYIFFWPETDLSINITLIPMFLGPILLFIGFIINNKEVGNLIKIIGWIAFAFYWATQPAKLYIEGDGDVFNGLVCSIGVYVLSYFAYHEWLSLKRKETTGCLNWIAGASGISGLVYYIIERTPLYDWMIKSTADQSAWVANVIIGNTETRGIDIFYNGEYVVTIIFACTAIQAMAIFIGMIGALPKVEIKKRVYCILVTLIPIYFLNLFRNAMVVYLVGNNITDFNIAHNFLSKTGALITLIILLFIVIKIIPQVLDEIICITDLHKRNGPLEKYAKKLIGRKKQNEPSKRF